MTNAPDPTRTDLLTMGPVCSLAGGSGNQVVNPIVPVTNAATNANAYFLLHGVLYDEDSEDED